MMAVTNWHILCFAVLILTTVSARKCPQKLQDKLVERLTTAVQLEDSGEYDAALSVVTENCTVYPAGMPVIHGYQNFINFLRNVSGNKFVKMVHCEAFDDDTVAFETSLFIQEVNEAAGWQHEHTRVINLWKKLRGVWYVDYEMGNFGPPGQSDDDFVNDENDV